MTDIHNDAGAGRYDEYAGGMKNGLRQDGRKEAPRPTSESVRRIPRPEVSVSQIVLVTLAQMGRATFKQLRAHPNSRLLAADRSENSFYTALARLKRRRMIARGTDHHYELTTSGEYSALKAYVRKEVTGAEKLQVTNDKLRIPTWDGKWRIVLFDVPESKRPIRDYLRGVLKRLGFKEFQRSMWVWPYKLPGFVIKLIADPQMRKYTRAITTYDIDYDDDLRRLFRLQ